MTLLAAQLFREVRPDFFRVLAGPLARLYVDALDALERETISDKNRAPRSGDGQFNTKCNSVPHGFAK